MSSNRTLYYSIEKIRGTFSKVSITSFFKIAFPLSNNGNGIGGGLLTRLQRAGVLDYNASNGLDPIEHLELLCSSTILPGPSFKASEVIGNRQGIVEKYPLYKQYPELAMTFFVDSNHKIIRFFEEWTNFINPLYGNSGAEADSLSNGQIGSDASSENSYYRLRYPDQYTQNILVTKFERDLNSIEAVGNQTRVKNSSYLTYKFIKAYPNNIIASPVSYNGSDILTYTVTFNYSRYIVLQQPALFGATLTINDATTQQQQLGDFFQNPLSATIA